MENSEIQKTEDEISKLIQKLETLRRNSTPELVKNYSFTDLNGQVSLSDLFGSKKVLFAIHNMGQGCRYCTLWADGLNSFLPHLEDQFAVVLLSKDSPEVQRQIANSRAWRFQMASHGGGDYIREQSVKPGELNMPGIVCYIKKEGQIYKKNFANFGPGDLFCTQWHILSLAGICTEEWTPQFNYWKSPIKLDDGGQNIK